MVEIPTLDTERLRLRPYRLDDFDAYAAMWADPAVVRFIGGVPFTREASWARFLRQIGQLASSQGFGFFAIEDKASGAFAGECGFHDLTPRLSSVDRGDDGNRLGALRRRCKGKGLAEEAMRAAYRLGRRATRIPARASPASSIPIMPRRFESQPSSALPSLRAPTTSANRSCCFERRR